jgi:hypothetical protein
VLGRLDGLVHPLLGVGDDVGDHMHAQGGARGEAARTTPFSFDAGWT